jgi:glucose-6-phosphate dehydrogenase assembly protein OpcA
VEEAVTTSPVNEAVARVESELSAFWAAPDTSTGEAAVKVRAATMSFVVVASQAEAERLRAATEDLAQTHAGRAFLVGLDGRIAPWEAATDLYAVCRIDGSVPICYDRVEIMFGAMAAERAASVVRALALPEVPVVLEAAAGAPSLLIDALAPICDRVIVDSAHMPLARVAEVIERAGGPVADRAFVRTFSWRELTARFFDEAPSAARAIRRVTVGRTTGGKVDPTALFIGWLASRLGWSFNTNTKYSATDAAGRPVEIALADEPRADVPPGVLTSVRIATEIDGAPLELRCARTDAPGIVRWTMEGARTLCHEHPLGFRDETWVLIKAIDALEGDRVFREAALAAADWSAR